jgi:co-chaperonin GroES (HSP10)
MQSISLFILRPNKNKEFDNRSKSGLILSNNIENHRYTNRIGIVEEVPFRYKGEIKKGDKVIVHHNTFRIVLDVKGRVKYSTNNLNNGQYSIPEDMIFAYYRDNMWNTINGNIFVEPILNDKQNMAMVLARYKPLHGKVVYSNKKIKDVKIGDDIVFAPNSEYEFNIGDRLLYKMKIDKVVTIL